MNTVCAFIEFNEWVLRTTIDRLGLECSKCGSKGDAHDAVDITTVTIVSDGRNQISRYTKGNGETHCEPWLPEIDQSRRVYVSRGIDLI